MQEQQDLILIITHPEFRATLTQLLIDNKYLITSILLTEPTEKTYEEVLDVPIIGTLMENKKYLELLGNEENLHYVALEKSPEKQKELEKLLLTYTRKAPVNVIHPSAWVSPYISIGKGNLINSLVTVAPYVTMDSMNYIGHNAVLEERVRLGSYVKIESGAVIRSGAVIEDGAFIGAGSIIYNKVRIGKNAVIASGSVVMRDVLEGRQVFGNPAKEI